MSAGIFAGVWARTGMDVLPKGADSRGFATAGIFGAGAGVTISHFKSETTSAGQYQKQVGRMPQVI